MNNELFLTALSNRFLEAADAWKDLGRQPTHCETDMIDLAGHCEGQINEANRKKQTVFQRIAAFVEQLKGVGGDV